MAGRAALEAVLPCAIGAVAGLALAFAFVYGVGPNGALSHDASSEALAASGFAGVAAIVAIAAVSTVSFLRHSEHHRRRFAVLGTLPWELILIALSLVILERLRRGGAAVADLSPDTEAPSLLLFAFPVAFLAGFVALVARGLVLLLGRARDRSARWGTPAYLAVHRLAARPRLTMLLITTTGLCLGLFIQAQTVARSMATTVDAKAGAYVGSDVQVRINDYNETPNRFPLPLTRVVRRPLAGVLRGDVRFDLLAIDTDTFASAAFWDPSFSSEPLDDLVRRLSRPSDGALPVVVASAPQADPSSVTIDARTVPVEMVGRADAFPGMLSRRPLVVVDAERLVDAFGGQGNPLSGPGGGDELWIRGDPAVVRDALAGLSYRPNLILTADEVQDIPHVAAGDRHVHHRQRLGAVAALLAFVGHGDVPAGSPALPGRLLRALDRAWGWGPRPTPAGARDRARRDDGGVVHSPWGASSPSPPPGSRSPVSTPSRRDPAGTAVRAPPFLDIGVASLVGTAAAVWDRGPSSPTGGPAGSTSAR